MSAESHEPARYWAFISYSHKDRRWGDWLHRSLETYRVPRRLVGRASRDGVVPARVFPIFRDREELPVSADLGQNINQALRESRYLIVICSPRAAASRWVNEEVLYFKRLGRAERILALIVDGEPNASDGKPGVPAEDECFPQAMRFHIGETGELSALRAEPIAADARGGKDGRDNARLKLLAGLLGVNYDALKRRDERRRRARRLLAAGIGLVIAVLLAGQWAWQERAKTGALSRQLASAYRERAERFVEKADDVGAALYFAQSNALSPSRAARDAAVLRLQELVLPRRVFEHGTAIETVAFAPDGRRLLTAGDGGRVRVWDAGSGELVTEFRMDVDTYMFKRASFTRDGKRIFTAAENARLWDAQTGRPLTPAIPFKTVTSTGKDLSGSTVSESIYVDCAALDPDERQVVLHWNEEGYVQFWNADTAQPAGERAAYSDSLVRLAFLWDGDPIPRFSPDRRISVFSDYFQPLQLTDLKANKRMPGTPRHDGVITAAAFSPDSRWIVTGGSEGTARVWDAATGLPRGAPMRQPGAVSLVKYAPAGRFMLTAAGTTAELWNDAGQLEMVMPHPGEVAAAAFSADGKAILTATKDGTAFLWAVEDRRALPREVTYAGWDRARLMALSPDGRFLLTQWVPERRVLGFRPTTSGGMEVVTQREGEAATHLQYWEIATGRPLWNEVPYEPEVEQAVFSPDGSRVATIDKSNVVRCWDTKTGKPLGPPFQASERTGGDSETPGIIVEFSPDGGRLLLVQNLYERANANGDLRFVSELRMLDPSTGAPVGPAIKLRDHVHGAAFRRSGDVLLADGKGVEVWPANGDALGKEPLLKAEGAVAIALSPDERTLCVLTRNTARLWDIVAHAWLGAPMKKAGMTEVHTATFSPNSRLLLTRDGSVTRLWDARTGEPVGQPFELGGNFHFGQGLPRFADDTHLLAPRRSVVQQKDLSLLLGDATPEAILHDAQLFTHRRLNADGDAEVIPAGMWEAMRRGRVVH